MNPTGPLDEPTPGNFRPSDRTPATRAFGNRIADLAMLYASKTSAVLVGVLILPQFSKLLGPDQFGIVALVLSFQALLLMLDLGVSTLVSRDVAASRNLGESGAIWRTGEATITIVYLGLLGIVAVVAACWNIGVSVGQALMALLLFWALTLQNIGQCAALAKRRFTGVGVIQIVGVAMRGVMTLLALHLIAANLTVFLGMQAAVALAHMLATRWYCKRVLEARSAGCGALGIDHVRRMLKRGAPLALFSLAGAAVMQLDKPIVSAFTSAATLAPYYLATTLCLVPLSLLAAPVAQYFQPRLVTAITANDDAGAHRVLNSFSAVICLVALLPSGLLWVLREDVIGLWLGSHSALVGQVSLYTGILLPGVTLGAIGFVPYSILLAQQEFRFQALASTALTVLTLAATLAFAFERNILGVCWTYSFYHAASTLVSWFRCLLQRPAAPSAVSLVARRTAFSVAIAAGLVLVFATGLQAV